MNTRSAMFLTTSVLPLSMKARSTGRPGKVTCLPAGLRIWFVGTTMRPSGWMPTFSRSMSSAQARAHRRQATRSATGSLCILLSPCAVVDRSLAGDRPAHLGQEPFHVVPDILLGRRVAQQVRRVKGAHDLRSAVREEAAAHPADAGGDAQEVLRCRGAEAANVLGVHQFQLPVQEGPAIGRLVRQRLAVAGRPAPKDIAYVHIFTPHATGGDDPVEELTGGTDKGLALAVFIGAGRLADEAQFHAGVADAEDR